jgi:hypothetical protein
MRAAMRALRQLAGERRFLLVGDSKLVSWSSSLEDPSRAVAMTWDT